MNIKEHILAVKAGKTHIKDIHRSLFLDPPEVAIITGSAGPLELKNLLTNAQVFSIPREIPGPKIEGHEPKMMIGLIENKRFNVSFIWIMGRAHMNEQELHDNYSDVTMVRVLASLGIKNYVISSMVGSLDVNLKPGHVCLVKDHIGSFVPNPLAGNPEYLRELSSHDRLHIPGDNLYDPGCRERLIKMVQEEEDRVRDIKGAKSKYPFVRDGDTTYTMIRGPQFETPSEAMLYGNLGSNVQGMSVVREVCAIKHIVPTANIITMCMVSNMVLTSHGSLDENGIATHNPGVSHENNLRAVKAEDKRFAQLIYDYVGNRLFEAWE